VSGPEVRIIAGGRVGTDAERAIVDAVSRVVAARTVPQVAPRSAWANAARLEGSGRPVIGSRAALATDRPAD
jgi:hypothetical protein